MSELTIEEEIAGDVLVLAPHPRVDSTNAKVLETEVMAKISSGHKNLVLDFADLEYISSAGLRVVLLAGKKLKAADGAMVLANLQPTIRDVFEISGFLRLFKVEESRAAAVEAAG